MANKKETKREVEKLLEVKDLATYFHTDEGVVKAVDGVSFCLSRNETLGLVGETGCGKTITALSIMRLLEPPGRIISGRIGIDGTDILKLTEQEMLKIRGNRLSMIFQEPMTSLNPVLTVGYQIAETLMLHEGLSKQGAKDKAIEMLEAVRISSPERRYYDYPHLLSGGMRQRVMIAMALACRPDVLIADEPTTALDVTIQAQIITLLEELQERFSSAILLITHNLGLVAEMADNVVVMYAGKIVEQADAKSVFSEPKHPYTQGLLSSIPRLGLKLQRLNVIKGSVPHPLHMPPGCAFAPRCSFVMDVCKEMPELLKVDGALVRCWLYAAGKKKKRSD